MDILQNSNCSCKCVTSKYSARDVASIAQCRARRPYSVFRFNKHKNPKMEDKDYDTASYVLESVVEDGHYELPPQRRTSPRRNHNRPPMVVTATAAVVARGATAAEGNNKKKRISKPRGYNYDDGEVIFMLESIESVLPIGRIGWDLVEAMHTEHPKYGRRGRTHLLLKNKFSRMVNMKKRSGDAEPPDDVLEAKRVMNLMNEKADAGADVDDLELGLDPGSDEDNASVAVDNDRRVAVAPRRLLTTPRSQPAAKTPYDQLMGMMMMAQTERMTRPAAPTSSSDSTLQQMLKMQQTMIESQQKLLDRIADRLDKLEK
jgi:flagellum-specific peptidoglycan hydrolase FlgJ